MAEKRPKAHHFVPQFYLRRFAEKRKNDYYTWCYDKTNGRSFQSNIKNLAVESGFYEIRASEQIALSAEPWIRDIESRFAKALDVLDQAASLAEVSEDTRQDIAAFLAFQEVRTTAKRIVFEQMRSQLVEKWPMLDEFCEELTKNELTAQHLGLLQDVVPEMASIVAGMKWCLCENATGSPLWASDNPVFRHNKLEFGFFSNMGLLCPGIEVYLPLTPERMLLACDPVRYGALSECSGMNDSNVTFCNCGQVIWSRRYLFSRTSDFSLADQYLSENPDYRDPDRPRILAG